MLKRRGLNGRINYYNKKYENPFFSRRRTRRVRAPRLSWSGRAKLIAAEILVLLAGIIWFCFFSSVFAIEAITVEGPNRASAREIGDIAWRQTREKRLFIIPQKNLFLFSKNSLIKSLNKNYLFAALTVDKKLPAELIIRVQEKDYAFIWQAEDRYYYVDVDNDVIDEVSPLDIKQKIYPLINDQRSDGGVSGISDNKINLGADYVNYIMALFNEFSGEAYGFTVEKFIVDDEINTVKMAIQAGPVIYFNINEELDKQVSKLVIIKNERLKDDFDKKSYIDLRYGDKVYYR